MKDGLIIVEFPAGGDQGKAQAQCTLLRSDVELLRLWCAERISHAHI